jgi:hypothetical protein
MIAEQLPNLKSRKRLTLKPKLDPERSLWPSLFFFEEINALKRQLMPEKIASSKKSTREGGIPPLSPLLKLTLPLVVMKVRSRSTCLLLLNPLVLAKLS